MEPGKDRNREEFLRALHNCVYHAKRSLLDFADFHESVKPELRPLMAFVKKRIHNDVSIIESQMLAAFEIYCNGGVIPPFGRSEEERAAGIGPRGAVGR